MTTTTKPSVKFSTNEYDVDMLEITGEKRSTFISVKKALAILDTNDDGSLIKEVQKHCRTMYNVTYLGTAKSFTVGISKIDTVLSASSDILLALVGNAMTVKEA